MRKNIKGFAVLFLALTLSSAPASAESWLQKVKNFFSPAADPAATEQTAETAPSAEPEENAAPQAKPVFDFSEKTFGDPNAPLKINIFTSLTCPHCVTVHTRLVPYLKETYAASRQAQIILDDFPLENRALLGSQISRCLTGDNYDAFMDTLFENQMKWAVAPNAQEALAPYARLAGLSEDMMVACATDESATKRLIRDRNLMTMKYKLRATPTLIFTLGGVSERIEGAPDRQAVDALIDKLKKTYKGEWLPEQTDEPDAPVMTAP